jgi:UDP-GlcNAc3NAcA epimerase
LQSEGIPANRIVPVGDVMFDVALHHASRAKMLGQAAAKLGLHAGHYALATVHRAENTDDSHRLGVIVRAFEKLAQVLRVIWPIHPRTRAVLQRQGLEPRGVELIDPVGYLDMVQLERDAALIATDSGGVQKEAFFHRVPCVTLRDETEWVELVDAGWNRLAPPTEVSVVSGALHAALGSVGSPVQPYGVGDAAVRIVQCLRAELGT